VARPEFLIRRYCPGFDGGTQKQSQGKNVENPGVKSTPGAPTSLRSATPSPMSLLDIEERIYDGGTQK
jgi:hypothetical protein